LKGNPERNRLATPGAVKMILLKLILKTEIDDWRLDSYGTG
jgi:hypothetical protein